MNKHYVEPQNNTSFFISLPNNQTVSDTIAYLVDQEEELVCALVVVVRLRLGTLGGRGGRGGSGGTADCGSRDLREIKTSLLFLYQKIYEDPC